ncbi:MAG: winged helix-turn-helix transcriptional regulator, partial [Christensenellaceae bacterium]
MKRELRLDIIDILEDNSRTTPAEISMMLDVSEDVVKKEIKKLEDEKVIVKYTAFINRQALSEEDDHEAEALIEVQITPQRDYGYDDMAKRIYQYDEVQAVYLMAGTYDL